MKYEFAIVESETDPRAYLLEVSEGEPVIIAKISTYNPEALQQLLADANRGGEQDETLTCLDLGEARGELVRGQTPRRRK
jgi:hypothetical protein